MPSKSCTIIAFAVSMLVVLSLGQALADDLPGWAFPISPPAGTPPPDDGKVFTLAGSNQNFTVSQFRDFFTPPDWYPNDHADMPTLVAHGAKPNAFACGFCHLPSGAGRPENAPIAGLPVSYIIRQVQDMASGARKSALPDRYPQVLMTKVAAQAATDPGLAEAAAYFASLKPISFTKVVESDTIPKIEISHWILKKADSGGSEPLGDRLVEVPDDFSRFLVRDSHLTYTAYVPKGSLAKGEDLVKTGGGKTTPCEICHGRGLNGLGPVPPIAGRSPSYIARQLFDMRAGARNGEGAALMKAVVAQLSDSDIVAITAYVASQQP